MSDISTRALTAEELLRLPDDDRRLELIEGELREMPPAGAEHGTVAFHIAALLQRHITAHRPGGASLRRPDSWWHATPIRSGLPTPPSSAVSAPSAPAVSSGTGPARPTSRSRWSRPETPIRNSTTRHSRGWPLERNWCSWLTPPPAVTLYRSPADVAGVLRATKRSTAIRYCLDSLRRRARCFHNVIGTVIAGTGLRRREPPNSQLSTEFGWAWLLR